MEEISCPHCNREFVVPPRYKIKQDDFDYLPIPRMLSCLHTCCHSCLEAMRERSKVGKVTCPICKTEDIVKGVDYIPLDLPTLKRIVDVSKDEVMSHCARCYDNVASVSWCDTCSSALCEFHHQDHKLSVDTARHDINTFKEISHKKLHIEYKFPPPCCPEVVLSDCAFYCQTCLQMISAQAMVQNHRGHDVVDYESVVEEMTVAMQDTRSQAETISSELQQRIDEIQDDLEELDTNEQASLDTISETFQALQEKLAKRERDLTAKLTKVAEEKRRILLSQLSKLSAFKEDSDFAAATAANVLIESARGENEPRYLVAAAESIEFRTDSIQESIQQSFKNMMVINTFLSSSFVEDELNLLSSVGVAVGAVHYKQDYFPDYPIHHKKSSEINLMPPGPPAAGGGSNKSYKYKAEEKGGAFAAAAAAATATATEAIKTTIPAPKISFSVKLSDALSESSAFIASSTTPVSLLGSKDHQHITIEARLLMPAAQQYDSHMAQTKDSKEYTNGAKNGIGSKQEQNEEIVPVPESARDRTLGELVGSVVIHTDIDRKILGKHELKSYFESYRGLEDHLPVMKIVKEFQAPAIKNQTKGGVHTHIY